MKITLNNLKKIINISFVNNIKDEQIFDYYRIVKINSEEILNEKNVLFFPIQITEKESEDEGWYRNTLDNRTRINEYIENNPERFYVVDKQTANTIKNKNAKYIIVDDIMLSVDKLFNYVMLDKKEFILATGSVGKTTTISLIEQIINENVLRIYSKRITPLVLKQYIINFSNKDIDYIVMEAGLYKKFQVEYYARLLKPKIGILINIEKEHFGIDGISSLDDIIISKAKLLLYCDYAIINNMDETIKQLDFNNNEIRYKNILIGKHHLKKIIRINNYDNRLKPYINTNLSRLQSQIAKETGLLLGMDEKKLIKKINKAIPKENRIQKIKYKLHTIIFDGEVSGVARFKVFSNHNYKKAILIIEHLTNDGEENEDYIQIIDTFKKYNKVYVNKNIKEANLFINCSNVVFYENFDFIKKISKNVQIFYHYGSYYRKYNEFNKEILFGGNK